MIEKKANGTREKNRTTSACRTRRHEASFYTTFFIAALSAPTAAAFHQFAHRESVCQYLDVRQARCTCAKFLSMISFQNESPGFAWKRRHAKSVFEGIRGVSFPLSQNITSSSTTYATLPDSGKEGRMRRMLSLSALVKEAQEESFRGLVQNIRQVNETEDLGINNNNVIPSNVRIPPDVLQYQANANLNRGLVSQLLPLAVATTADSISKVGEVMPQDKPRKRTQRQYAGRAIAGLIAALAEEALDLNVEVHTQHHTPLWRKTVDCVKISFSKLGFKPLRIRGVEFLSQTVKEWEGGLNWKEKREYAENLRTALMSGRNRFVFNRLFGTKASDQNVEFQEEIAVNAVEAFRQMDTDNSGTLEKEELLAALNMAVSDRQDIETVDRRQLAGSTSTTNEVDLALSSASSSDATNSLLPSWTASRTEAVLERLAARLVQLYDFNGNGVVDQSEYLTMVEDMAELRRSKRSNLQPKLLHRTGLRYISNMLASSLWNLFTNRDDEEAAVSSSKTNESNVEEAFEVLEIDDISVSNLSTTVLDANRGELLKHTVPLRIPKGDPMLVGPHTGEGSILIENLKLDLRRLVFGAVPIIKNLVPGGPLILEPFTLTATGSFKKDDIMESVLLQAGLKRLVARALRRRVRSFRDIVDGAHFFGRTWTLASKEAPQVDLPEITNVEFDAQDRMIITGRARLRTSLTAPEINNAFKLRTKFGTREDGRMIRLDEPELALVVECPRVIERNIVLICKSLGLPIPKRPEPLYTYFPLVSNVKVSENDGFDLGQDNCIKTIEIRNGSLRFEICSILRPGRFLGNHYLAFSVPNRTFIITLDRVLEGVKAARHNKRLMRQTEKEYAGQNFRRTSPAQSDLRFAEPEKTKSKAKKPMVAANPLKENFLSRFVRGYMGASSMTAEEREEELNERLTEALSEWFGRQIVRP